MQVSIAKVEEGTHFVCGACKENITKTHVLVTRERKQWHLCNADCYAKWRKQERKAA